MPLSSSVRPVRLLIPSFVWIACGTVLAMLVIMVVRERLAGRPFQRVAEMALGVFIFFSSALVLERGGELRDPVL